MPKDIRLIHAHEFIQASPEGMPDLEAKKGHTDEIAARSAPEDDYDIILSTRSAQMDLVVTDLWYLAAELHKHPEKHLCSKTAFLFNAKDFDHAGFFALCAQERGFEYVSSTATGRRDGMARRSVKAWLERQAGPPRWSLASCWRALLDGFVTALRYFTVT